MHPEVSVLMPMRDAAGTLAVALKSVLRSRAVGLEVIALEHASRDETPRHLARLAARDARVVVRPAPADLPLGAVLELGRCLCRAPFVARMDADDVMHPDRLAADVAWLRERPALAAVACQVRLAPRRAQREGRHAGLAAYVAWQNQTITAEEHARELWIEQPLCQPATTFRASALASVGGWRAHAPPFPEDYDLYLRLANAGFALEKRAALHHAWRIHARTTDRLPRDLLADVKCAHLVERFGLRVRPVVVVGAGKEGRRIGRALGGLGVVPQAWIDVAADKVGRLRRGVRVRHLDELGALRAALPGAFALGAVGTSGARGVVRGSIAAAGFVEGESFVVVA